MNRYRGGPPAAPSGASRLLFIISLGLLQSIWPLTMDLYLPAFPQLQRDLGTNPAHVQLTLTSAFIGMAVGQLVAGPVSDAIGRQRPLAVSLTLYTLATAGCALAPSIELLIAGRLLQGLGAAGCAVISVAMVRDTASGAPMLRLLARLSIVSGVFVVLSPALGAQLLSIVDWRGLFWLLGVFGIVLIVVAAFGVLRTESNTIERRMLRGESTVRDDYRLLAASPEFRGIVVGGGIMFAGMMAYMGSSAFLFQDVYGLTPTHYAIIFGGHGALMIVGAQVSARLSRRISPRRIVLVGFAGLTASAAALLLSVTLIPDAGLPGFLIPLLFFTTCFGLIGPALQTHALAPHGHRAGTAASLIGASNMVFAAVVSPIAGLFGVATPTATVAIMLVCEAAAFAIFVAAFRRRPAGP